MSTDPGAVQYLSTGRELIASFSEHLGANLKIRTDSKNAYIKAGIVLSLAIHVRTCGR